MSYDREQRVRERAYSLWESAGRPEGRHQEFWAMAERLIAQESSHDTPHAPDMIEEPPF